jgi:hypothetical protein
MFGIAREANGMDQADEFTLLSAFTRKAENIYP